jgi:hypothetical protein
VAAAARETVAEFLSTDCLAEGVLVNTSSDRK